MMRTIAPIMLGVALSACDGSSKTEATCTFQTPPQQIGYIVYVEVPESLAPGRHLRGSQVIPEIVTNMLSKDRQVRVQVNLGNDEQNLRKNLGLSTPSFHGKAQVDIYKDGCAVRKVEIDGKVVQGK